jgi:diguanylate cyclase (GGDEF)-like protein
MGASAGLQPALAALAEELRGSSWELALDVVDEGVRDGTMPSLARLGRIGQVGDMPTFINELGRELLEPPGDQTRRALALASLVRDHARERESLGFEPREIVTEFLLLRRVLWRFVSDRATGLEAEDVLALERRLNDTIDRLVTECVVAYFDRATSELADQARHDALTGLLNHQAFGAALEEELTRAARYRHGVTVAFVDVDEFKAINDTHGHLEGDRVLGALAGLLRESLRRTDLAGRLGGDEFAVLLLESEADTGGSLLARLDDRIDEERGAGRLPEGFSISAGLAHFPTEATTADSLLRLADSRLYEAKRAPLS